MLNSIQSYVTCIAQNHTAVLSHYLIVLFRVVSTVENNTITGKLEWSKLTNNVTNK